MTTFLVVVEVVLWAAILTPPLLAAGMAVKTRKPIWLAGAAASAVLVVAFATSK